MPNSDAPEQLELFPGTKFSIKKAVVLDSDDLSWVSKLNDITYVSDDDFV
ncbi:MAG: hypothetical protein H6797_03320 [Candidatus Nomurabacteria bacterium]|nr:MAG: hypothetical protein H6797_03320 [Candidatus Nomurabacteria bacterium]